MRGATFSASLFMYVAGLVCSSAQAETSLAYIEKVLEHHEYLLKDNVRRMGEYERRMSDRKDVVESELKDERTARRTLEEKYQELQTQVATLGLNKTGVAFTRWGRKVCPLESTLVYEGFAGGAYYSSRGGASNYLCLPPDPIYNRFDAGPNVRGYLYGAEYEMKPEGSGGPGDRLFSFANAGTSSFHNHNVPCAVCHVQGRTALMMLPARNKCYPGWHLEYQGYLMSDHSGHHRTEFVCMDEAPEVGHGGSSNQNGAVLFHVESMCGSLPCPPYRNRHELTCVVCTK